MVGIVNDTRMRRSRGIIETSLLSLTTLTGTKYLASSAQSHQSLTPLIHGNGHHLVRIIVLLVFHTLQINAAASTTTTNNNNNTIYVCTSDGIDVSSCGFNQTSPCKTIGYGIQQAPSNSTISIICGGSYVESSIRVSNKNLTIFNDATISSTSTASSIVDITGFNQVGPLFHFESSASRLIGLSISKCSLNGVPSNSSSNNSGGGGAVLVDPTATLEIVSCIFQDNSITIGYGGAVLSYGALRVIDSNFTDNYISTDGAANDLDQSPDTLQSYGGAIAIVLAHMPAFPIEISNSLFMRNAVIAPNERQDTNAINEIDRARSQSPARAREIGRAHV